MTILGKIVIARDGWPLEMVRGRHIANAIRFILLASPRKTFTHRNRWAPAPGGGCYPA